MKYVNQLEYPHFLYPTDTDKSDEERLERRKYATIKSSGCGICSAVMMADRLLIDPKFDLVEATQLSYECGGNHAPGTDYKRYAPALAERLNLKWEGTNDPERVRQCLRTGGAVVCNVGGDKKDGSGIIGIFSHGGHYILAIAEQEDGRIVVLDPSQKPGKFDEPGREGKVEEHGEFCLVSMEDLVIDCSNRDPGFYCFWRKYD